MTAPKAPKSLDGIMPLLGVSENTVRRWVKALCIQPIHVGHSKRPKHFFAEADVARLVEYGKQRKAGAM